MFYIFIMITECKNIDCKIAYQLHLYLEVTIKRSLCSVLLFFYNSIFSILISKISRKTESYTPKLVMLFNSLEFLCFLFVLLHVLVLNYIQYVTFLFLIKPVSPDRYFHIL